MQGSIFKRVQHVCEKGKPRWVRLLYRTRFLGHTFALRGMA